MEMKEGEREKRREIRIFVSSTFRDMQAEREDLVKRIFPQLRKLCESRNVTFAEVDLRWGISDEQKAEGKVLPICLAEIQRCRPYFIGLLGERYGWIPQEISLELIESEPWLKEHRSHSVTELEILHGVLNNPKMADQTFFYFRSPEYLKNLPKDSAKSDFISEDVESENKLKDLKRRIKESGLPLRENYPTPKAMADLVLQDLTEVIEKRFPEGSQPDALDREAAEHEIFAQSRARVYIGGKEYFAILDRHAQGEAQPLVILGESGSGKSALLANWALKYKKEHPDDLVFMHFIGASASSTDWASMLRRMMAEFKRRFGISQDIPEKSDELRSAFANWLNMAATKGKTILVIDALNQLEDREGALDVVWLPPVIPENIRILLSTLPGRSLNELTRRKWQALEVRPLGHEERRQLVIDYLSLYTKTLSAEKTEKIVSATQSANPLFLKALLEELRVFGIYEKLDERIRFYLESKSIPELFEKILSRYEEDYESERPGLVRDSMGLLWAARRGLSESELLELLSAVGNRLPRAVWSPLFLAAEQSLVNRSGLINFFHDHFRQAIENRYVQDENTRREYHLKLADYFEARELGTRKVDELPWQLVRSKTWNKLFTLLANQDFFLKAWDADEYNVKSYWVQLEMNSNFRMVECYKKTFESPKIFDIDFLWKLGILFAETGHLKEASSLSNYFFKYSKKSGDQKSFAASLISKAIILQVYGDLDGAMKLSKQAEGIYRELGDNDGLQISLGIQAVILDARGELDNAMALHKEEERICRELGNKNSLQTSLGNQALIHKNRGDLDGAMKLYMEQKRICLEMGNKNGLQDFLGNQASILYTRGDLDGAMKLFKEQEKICRELGSKNSLAKSLGSQAVILQNRGDLNGAMAMHKEEERICRELYMTSYIIAHYTHF